MHCLSHCKLDYFKSLFKTQQEQKLEPDKLWEEAVFQRRYKLLQRRAKPLVLVRDQL